MIRRRHFTLFLLIGWVVGTTTVDAATLIEPFPLASPETETRIQSQAHRVLLSPVREVNDEIRSESVARVPVSGLGLLLKIDIDSNRREAREYYRSALAALGANILFECSGRACGRSNVWANQIFGQAILYGRDANQDYLAAVVQQGETNYLILVYTVTRGNYREYAWTEQLELGANAVVPGLGGANGRVRGPLIVPWTGGFTYRFEWDATDRRRLNEWAASSGADVVIISHSTIKSDESLAESMQRATNAAEAMSALLQKSGISLEQQRQVIAGPTIPSDDPARAGDRVELVVIAAP
ncbi:DUF4892 domain-containing protein [Marinobacter sp. SS21]|uniref:DUF4892 domain-containing protein n=1 Tax=Marinobacter sp. SS21 TaxID=2979460 RepID=UPI00232FDDE2|nr:DUF4892 domain-containing protein [Marinobacter sp. SS21]MDC0661885.1 DUF4892 domain-containing protein [Marinobacter sp. SS21]